MKVLYISDAKSIHTRRWAEHFRDLGYEIHVASFRSAVIPGVIVHLLPTYGLGRFGYFLAIPTIRALLKSIRPDVVHAQYLTSYGFLAVAAQAHPLITTAWGTDVLISPGESHLSRFIASFALRYADVVTTVAEHMDQAVVDLGARPEDVVSVPFGVNINVFHWPDLPTPGPPPLRVISTRNFAKIYSVHTVVNAVQILHDMGCHVLLDLVGDGPLRTELEAQVKKAMLHDIVFFHGHVESSKLVELLGSAHIFVSSALSDGNNVSLNEAMACGCFPIATDIPANSQWIAHGVNGFLFPAENMNILAELLVRVSSDNKLRDEARVKNRMIVKERANWNVCTKEMQSIYEKLAAGGASYQ